MKIIYISFLVLLYFYTLNANADIKYSISGSDNCPCAVGAAIITSATRKITLVQAKALVMAALTPEQRRMPGVAIDIPGKNSDDISSYERSYRPRFLIFNVVWAAKMGSDNIGFYGVDIYTGDVFDLSPCAEYYSKKLEALQNKIRRSLHLTDSEYKKLKTNGPECTKD
ncbi:MAG: hypothetical protein LBH31_02740 [Burkholderiaceae bacterium]|jgi:hypothetical protein|nr:hypothetical protein [Burkholderiaceae bacterium]